MAVRKNAPALPLGLLLLVLAAGALLALGATWILVGRKPEGPAPFVPPPNTVAVPMAARDIHAYTKVSRDDLFSPRLQRLTFLYLPPDKLNPEMITDLSRVIGRVLSRDKREGFVFTEKDFLAEGTRPGVVAGIPAGKRALRLEAEKVQGLIGLLSGDRFDIVATQPVEAGSARGPALSGPYGALLGSQLGAAPQRAVVRVVVQSGVVVTPVETRLVPVSTTSLTQGARTQTRPVQEMVVAIDPVEVAPLTEALAVDARLTCLPRSGRPDDPVGSITPGSAPALPGRDGQQVPPLEVLDRIQGSARDFHPVPRAQGGQ